MVHLQSFAHFRKIKKTNENNSNFDKAYFLHNFAEIRLENQPC